MWIKSNLKQNIWRVYPDENDAIEKEKIDWDTNELAEDWFLGYITGIDNKAIEGKKVYQKIISARKFLLFEMLK